MKHPLRRQTILLHRQAVRESKMQPKDAIYKTAPALHSQTAPKSLAGLKEITLDDMDFSADKIYEGYCLTGTIIEPTYKMNAIHSILEDENGKVIKISFYNVGKLATEIVVGQVVIIMNPY